MEAEHARATVERYITGGGVMGHTTNKGAQNRRQGGTELLARWEHIMREPALMHVCGRAIPPGPTGDLRLMRKGEID